MSVTATQDQLELVNIISISETKLCNNFQILNRRLKKNDEIFNQFIGQIELNHSNVITRITQVQNQTHQEITQIKTQMHDILNELRALNESKVKHEEHILENEASFVKLNQQLFNTQLQFEEKLHVQNNFCKQTVEKIKMIQTQLIKINDEVSTKQNRVEVEKILKQIQHLKQKDTHFEAQIKLNQHKIEKIQILNQKNQRIQAKKDVEIIKEIEDKIKRQIKATLKATNIANSVTPIQSPQTGQKTQKNLISINSADKQNQLSSFQDQRKSSIRKRLPFNMEEDQILLAQLLKSNLDNPMSKITERINKLEVQQKDINQIIKASKFKKDDKTDASNNFKDKINEIKAQVVKLWAKFDTLEDRLAFNQKKMEEKTKTLNELVSHQKQNNWYKMDQKLKTLQTEIYTNLKDVRAKLETKVNIPDYEKFVIVNDDRIKQINQLIYLKSDKLEVKKALIFLESKIKEIILVISEDEENEKDALLTKKPIKCISCDKEVDKFTGNTSGLKGNWDNMPYKQHSPETLGRFGMTSFGSLAKKLKKLQSKDLPLLNNKKSAFGNNLTNPSIP